MTNQTLITIATEIGAATVVLSVTPKTKFVRIGAGTYALVGRKLYRVLG